MAISHPSRLKRTQRRELTRRLRSADPGLDVIHPNAAGIDVGNSAHYVAVRPDRDPDPVLVGRNFCGAQGEPATARRTN